MCASLARVHDSVMGEIPTSSDEAVCRSAAREKSSSRIVKTPSPSNSPCMHPSKRRVSLTSRHAPASRYSWIALPTLASNSSANSDLCRLIARAIAATKGILRGCSIMLMIVSHDRRTVQRYPYSWTANSINVVRNCSFSKSLVTVLAMVLMSSSILGDSAMPSINLLTLTCAGSSYLLRCGRRS